MTWDFLQPSSAAQAPGAEKADDTGSHREMVPREQKKKEAGKLRTLARQLTSRVVI